MTASVPEFTKRSRSIEGIRSRISAPSPGFGSGSPSPVFGTNPRT